MLIIFYIITDNPGNYCMLCILFRIFICKDSDIRWIYRNQRCDYSYIVMSQNLFCKLKAYTSTISTLSEFADSLNGSCVVDLTLFLK